jgi:ribonuclease T2
MHTTHSPAEPPRRSPLRRALPALALLLALALPASEALARHRNHHAARPRGEAVAGQFDYYLLSMSWSPTYCLTHPDNRAECGGRGYGLILHGLWPQYEGGGYPEDCASEARLDGESLRIGASLYPSESLLRHEWQKHGSCTGLSPVDYLHAADRATAVLKNPTALEAPHHDQAMTTRQLLEQLHAANPGLPEGALRIACTRDQLSEIRVCLTRDLVPRDCGRGVGGHCPADHLAIPAARPSSR